MARNVLCQKCSMGDMDPELCPNNRTTAVRGNIRKRHSTLVSSLKKSLRRSKVIKMSELIQARLKLWQWYEEASGINYHCQAGVTVPDRVQEFEEWQVRFDEQHRVIVQEIDSRMQPDEVEVTKKNDSDGDSSDEDENEASSSKTKHEHVKTTEHSFSVTEWMSQLQNEMRELFKENQQKIMQSVSQEFEQNMAVHQKTIMQSVSQEFEQNMALHRVTINQDVSDQLSNYASVMTNKMSTAIAAEVTRLHNDWQNENAKTTRQLKVVGDTVNAASQQLSDLHHTVQQWDEKTKKIAEEAVKQGVGDLRDDMVKLSQRLEKIENPSKPIEFSSDEDEDIVDQELIKKIPVSSNVSKVSVQEIVKRRRDALCQQTTSTPVVTSKVCSNKAEDAEGNEGSTDFSNDPSFLHRGTRTHHAIRDEDASAQEFAQNLIDLLEKGSLPPLPMIIFDGDVKEYPMFKAGFMARVENKVKDNATKLAYLQSLLSPDVKKVVSDCIRDPSKYRLIWQRLDDEYARPTLLARTHLNTMLDLPVVKSKDAASLKRFSVSLHTAVASMLQDGLTHDLRAQGNLRTVVGKLPEKMQHAWSRHAINVRSDKEVDITHLNDWLKTKVLEEEEYESMCLPKINKDDKEKNKAKKKWKPANGTVATINSVTAVEETPMKKAPTPATSTVSATPKPPVPKTPVPCFVCKGPMHRVHECPTFLRMTGDERAKVLFDAGRCFRCLTGKGHVSKDCPKKEIIFCKVSECNNRKHNTLLHGVKFPPSKPTVTFAPSPIVPSAPSSETLLVGTTYHHEQPRQRRTMFCIVPICVTVGLRKFDTYAFLDGGASSTLIRKDIATKMLGLCGPTKRTKLAWFDGSEKEVDATMVTFDITNREGSVKFRAYDSHAVDEIHMSSNVPLDDLPVEEWDHVQGLEFADVPSDLITVVIANDIEEAHDRLETRRAPAESFRPAAHRTHFGWVLAGRAAPPGITAPQVSIGHIRVKETTDESSLQELLKRFWAIESKQIVHGPVLSEEDSRGLKVLEETTRNIGNRYEIGIMWKSDQVKLPDNRNVALRRLFAQERRFVHHPEYAQKYHDVIQDYVSLGHARYLSKEEADTRSDRTWYLPHHGVISATSTTTKVRVVFDGAAEFQGTSLNDNMIRGPNLLNNLHGVALRARKHRFAVCSDIEKMYHQVLVPEHEQDAYRFIYRPPGSDSPPRTLRMKVHVFGSKTSPTTCLYALKRTAEDNQTEHPRAAESVTTSFYVDNYWESFATEVEAVKVAQELKVMLAKGGFNLTKWTSNSRKVLAGMKNLGLANPSSEFELEKLDVERTLGLLWDREDDSFIVKIKKKVDEDWRPTRKEFLSVVLSVFDPFGFLAPVTFVMKVLMQKVCGKGVKFDEEVPNELLPEFIKWCKELHHLESISIPRCFTKSDDKVISRQLHVFTDASNAGYGAVAYIRTVTESGQVDVAFVMAKTHVSPSKKKQTIPRLELLGEMEGLSLATLISRELKEDLKAVMFHTDSQIVLRWINSRTCKFEIFVENRIGKIVQDTTRRQWRFVPGSDNPADLCSRGLQPHHVAELKLFHHGPIFLRKEASEWPKWEAIDQGSDEELPEIVHINSLTCREDENIIEMCINKLSDKLKVQRVIAWCRRYVLNFKAKYLTKTQGMSGELSVDEMGWALNVCIKQAQTSCFGVEIKRLSSNESIQSSSDLRQLNPFLDSNGILRVGGRLEFSPFSYDVKHPIILPRTHQLTLLLVRNIHESTLHAKSERLLSEVRKKYWIPRCRQLLRSVVCKCVPCRMRNAAAITPMMASLPASRLTPYVRPFTFTGVDFFGPLMVSMGARGRRFEKRWVCLFTCLTIRAVHLEVAEGLSSDEFLLCFSRFCSIRGKPTEVWSDNGTNFVSAEKELREELMRLYQSSDIQANLSCKEIKWKFSPPNAPHFGGAWERLVQSCKRLLKVGLGNSVVNDRILRTIVAEVSAMVNARPLTKVSADPSDHEPLTPNHFLFGQHTSYCPLAKSELQEVKLSNKEFRKCQELLDYVWQRWITELPPDLLPREKWFEHQSTVQLGDVVLVHDPSNFRGQWVKGRVIELIPSKDKVVRTVKLKTHQGRGEIVRAVSRLIPLVDSNPHSIPISDPHISCSGHGP